MPAGRPKITAKDRRTIAIQALFTEEEAAAFDQLAREMADELGLGTMADSAVLRRLVLLELKRRGIHPPGAAKPSEQPTRASKQTPTKR